MRLMSPKERYIYAMLNAINYARQPVWIGENCQSMTDGLRVIKRFEKVNNTRFDPFNSEHVDAVTGYASCESFLRKTKRIYKHAKTI